MLLDFIKPHDLPHVSLIKKDTAYVLQDLDTQTAVIHFSTKDADPELYRTVSIADIYNVVTALGVGQDGLAMVSFPTRVDFDASPPITNSFVYIESDTNYADSATVSLFVADNSNMLLLNSSAETTATVWQSQEW